MPQDSYAYAVGRIRVLENRLLGNEKINRMLDAEIPEDVLKVLAESEYGMGQEPDSVYNYERLLSSEQEKTYQLIESITPNKSLTDLFVLQYDIHNLKVLLKARYLESAQDELLSRTGSVPPEKLRSAVNDKNYEDLPGFLQDALKRLENALSIKIDPQQIDIVLDRTYYDYIFNVCRAKRSVFLRDFFTKQVDLMNIKTLLRVKKIGGGVEFLRDLLINHGTLKLPFYLQAMDESIEQLMHNVRNTEYEKVMTEGIQAFIKDGTLTVYERLADNYLLDYVKFRRNNPFGIEAVIGYILAKENELKLVRIIMVGKINGIPKDRIQERLRDAYV